MAPTALRARSRGAQPDGGIGVDRARRAAADDALGARAAARLTRPSDTCASGDVAEGWGGVAGGCKSFVTVYTAQC